MVTRQALTEEVLLLHKEYSQLMVVESIIIVQSMVVVCDQKRL